VSERVKTRARWTGRCRRGSSARPRARSVAPVNQTTTPTPTRPRRRRRSRRRSSASSRELFSWVPASSARVGGAGSVRSGRIECPPVSSSPRVGFARRGGFYVLREASASTNRYMSITHGEQHSGSALPLRSCWAFARCAASATLSSETTRARSVLPLEYPEPFSFRQDAENASTAFLDEPCPPSTSCRWRWSQCSMHGLDTATSICSRIANSLACRICSLWAGPACGSASKMAQA